MAVVLFPTPPFAFVTATHRMANPPSSSGPILFVYHQPLGAIPPAPSGLLTSKRRQDSPRKSAPAWHLVQLFPRNLDFSTPRCLEFQFPSNPETWIP